MTKLIALTIVFMQDKPPALIAAVIGLELLLSLLLLPLIAAAACIYALFIKQ